jgi:thioredoxin-related protein
VYANLANQYKHVKFVVRDGFILSAWRCVVAEAAVADGQKVDVDRQAELAQRYAVRAMPTFKFIKGGREVAEVGPSVLYTGAIPR